MTVLALDGVRAGYGAADVLRGVDLTLEPGTITCLVGPNGAGKSTVLRTVSGLLRPRQGRILLDGDDIAGMSPGAVLRRGVVHVPQERGLFAGMTVWENVLMGAHILRDAGTVRRRAEAIAERFPIVAERRRDRAGALSGGRAEDRRDRPCADARAAPDPDGRAVDGARSEGAAARVRDDHRVER